MLLEISFTSQWLMTWLPRSLRWVTIVSFSVAAALALLLGAAGGLFYVIAIAVAFVFLSSVAACLIIADAAYRLMDSNRLVLLSIDRQASIDVIFGRRGQVLLREHGRLIGATSAPALRADVADWIATLENVDLDVRTWHRAIVELCMEHCPELEPLGRDGLFRIRLGRRLGTGSSALSRSAMAESEPAPVQPPRS